jgi:hypothetical protein
MTSSQNSGADRARYLPRPRESSGVAIDLHWPPGGCRARTRALLRRSSRTTSRRRASGNRSRGRPQPVMDGGVRYRQRDVRNRRTSVTRGRAASLGGKTTVSVAVPPRFPESAIPGDHRATTTRTSIHRELTSHELRSRSSAIFAVRPPARVALDIRWESMLHARPISRARQHGQLAVRHTRSRPRTVRGVLRHPPIWPVSGSATPSRCG